MKGYKLSLTAKTLTEVKTVTVIASAADGTETPAELPITILPKVQKVSVSVNGTDYTAQTMTYDLGATDAAHDALDKIVFDRQVEELCRELSGTLNTIFMYREENAYTVVRRINDLNRLVRSLAKIRTELSE